MGKQATKEDTMGIKKLSGKGIKRFMYEVKVKGKWKGNKNGSELWRNNEKNWRIWEKWLY